MKRVEENTIEVSEGDELTTNEKLEAKLDAKYERKRANYHKNDYKRMVPKTKFFS